MKGLLGTIVPPVIACLALGGCAKQGVDEGGFGVAPPDSSISTADGGITTLPMPGLGDGSLGFITSTGEGGAYGDAGAPSTLTFMPPTATVTIDGTGPKMASFTLLADFGSGPMQVTPQYVEFDRPDLAALGGASEPVVATAPSVPSMTPYAGTGLVHAIFHGKEATASLTVVVHLAQYAMGLNATSPGVAALNAATLPADPAPGIAPILYPYDKTVWPLGLTSPLVMWNGVGATDVYRLHYAETNYSVDYYTMAAPPSQARLDQTTWDHLTNSSETFHKVADPITFTLSRWDGVAQMAYASATETWSVAPESLRGAIYYWSASRGATGGRISQFRPGPGAMPTVLNTTGACAGCHAVNAQGTVLVADIEDPTFPTAAPLLDPFTMSRAWVSYDIIQATTPQTYKSNMFGADPALTPDGKYLVFGGPRAVAGAKYMSMADPATGALINNSGLDSVVLDTGETNLEMPAFSPDGTSLAVVEAANPGVYPQDEGASDNVLGSAALAPYPDAGPPPLLPSAIAYLTFDETGPTFNPTLHKITSSADPAFAAAPGLAYPSFTPDSKAVAFHAGTQATGCNTTGCGDDALDDGNLFIATIAGGGPIRLAAACDTPDMNDRNSSIEPTFNPVVRGGYSWAVFTSMRKVGNQPWPPLVTGLAKCAGNALCNAKRHLWLTAVDTTIGTTDPSHPAIYMEGQDFTTPNMRAFYTLTACIPSPGAMVPDAGVTTPMPGSMCSSGFECCSGFCQDNKCIVPNQFSCVGLGGACMQNGDCCNSPPVQCIGGVCTVPIAN